MTEILIFSGIILLMIVWSIWYSEHSYLYADVIFKDGRKEELGPFKSEADFQQWFHANQQSVEWFKAYYHFHLKPPYDTKSGS